MMKFVAVVLMFTVIAPSISAAGSPHAQTTAWEAVEQLPAEARLVESEAVTVADASSPVRGPNTIEVLETRALPLPEQPASEDVPQKRTSRMAKIFAIGAIAGGVVVGYYLWLLANSR